MSTRADNRRMRTASVQNGEVMLVTVFQHVPFETPGAISDWAIARGHELRTVRLWLDEAPDTADAGLLVVMGGPMGANDDASLPWLTAEKDAIAHVVGRCVPVLGVCLGAQLVAVALGAEVRRNPEPEIGWFPVRRALEGPARLPVEFLAFHWHGDTFDVPEGATLIGSSAACRNQGFSACGGKVLALQFHLEVTPALLSGLLEACGDEVARGGTWVQTAEEIMATPERCAQAHALLFDLLDDIVAAS